MLRLLVLAMAAKTSAAWRGVPLPASPAWPTTPAPTSRARHGPPRMVQHRLDLVTSLEWVDAGTAKEVAERALERADLPRAPAYLLRVNGTVRAALFVHPRDASQAVRMVYDPLLLLLDAMPAFRQRLYEEDKTIRFARLCAAERFDLLCL